MVRHPVLRGLIFVAVCAFLVAACSRGHDEADGLSPRVIPLGQPVPKGGGRYKIGSAYKAQGQWFQPHEDENYDETGVASWYGELFHGRRTANGEIYDMTALTAASPVLPIPVLVRVTNLRNGRSMVVRVNDRGPYARDRILDLSARSANLLGFQRAGTAPVRVEYLRRAPLNGDDTYERRYLAGQQWAQAEDLPEIQGFAPVRTARAKSHHTTIVAKASPAPLPGRAPAPPVQVASAAADPFVTGSITRSHAEPAAKAQSGGSIWVQAGAFSVKENAERLTARLRAVGPTELTPIAGSHGTLYRVRVGPWRERQTAVDKLADVVAAGGTGAKLVF